MFSNIKWLAPVAAFCVLAAFSFVSTRADDTAPGDGVVAADTGSLSVTVLDAAGKPVAGAKVAVMGKKSMTDAPATQPQASGGKKGVTVAKGVTDDQGTLTLKDIPAGDYRVVARSKESGRGMEKVTIVAGQTATVTINLKAPTDQ
jgi:uncharacterized GH25 family protein